LSLSRISVIGSASGSGTLLAMEDHEREPTQPTQPKKGEPIEIPVPKRKDVMDFLEKTAKLPDPDRSDAGGAAE
jgi:hypothetical protein